MITYSCGAWDSDMFTYYKTSEKTLIYSVPTTHLPFISLHSEDVRTKLFNAGEAVKRRLWRAAGARITVIILWRRCLNENMEIKQCCMERSTIFTGIILEVLLSVTFQMVW